MFTSMDGGSQGADEKSNVLVKGGGGYGVDEIKKVVDDAKGWVWLAA
eukprot:CAMPEP_0115135318 /NCGR_PEP_ID=MMETSP0227-20121206/55654_1 /TAXON_ID=89957 /ORGANISM="Polarella glacialis, Strain CCMP 1383" /LENGTH=46 /DNA_ID= /DNA_START= /DNA_END= /DNA_ORIENTATION=